MAQRPRIEYLGSADAASLVNIGDYACRRALVYKKVGIPVDDADAYRAKFESDEGPVTRGVELEPNIRARVARLIAPCVEWAEPASADLMPPRPPVPEWLDAHPDGIIGPLDDAAARRVAARCGITDADKIAALRGTVGILEAKTVQLADLMKIRKEGPRADHVVQVLHQLCATAAPWALIAYLNADQWRWLYFLVWREPEWERVSYIPAAVDAWHQITRAKAGINLADSPDEWEPFLPARLAEGSKACATCDFAGTCWGQEWLRVSASIVGPAEKITDDPRWDEAVRRALEARDIEADAEFLKNDADAVLKSLLGDRTLVETGAAKIHYKPVKSNRIDVTALRAAHPDIAAKFSKESESRPLKLYRKKA